MLKYYVIVDFRSENNEGAGMGAWGGQSCH
jgi:hypothetical protein